MENKLPLAGFPTLPRPNTPFALRSKKVLRSEVANCRPKSDHPLTLVSGPLLGLGAQNLYQGLTARKVDGRRHSCPLSHILNRVRHILTYVCLGNDTGTLAMSWTFLPGNLTATGPFFDRVGLLAPGCVVLSCPNLGLGRFGKIHENATYLLRSGGGVGSSYM